MQYNIHWLASSRYRRKTMTSGVGLVAMAGAMRTRLAVAGRATPVGVGVQV